ncbi:MAG: TlpA disulfide reductase family protein [Gemmatimonadaceae bacterium]
MTSPGERERWAAMTLAVVGVVATAVLVVAMGTELRALRPLRQQVKLLRALPMVGEYVPRVHTTTLAGDTITLGETTPGRSQLLFAVSAGCPTCKAMMPEMQRIADSLQRDGKHDVVFVSISPRDSTQAYVAEHGIKQRVVLLEDVRTTRLFRIKGVPMLLVLDRLGRVRYAHGQTFKTQAARDSTFAMTEEATTDRIRRPAVPSVAIAVPRE